LSPGSKRATRASGRFGVHGLLTARAASCLILAVVSLAACGPGYEGETINFQTSPEAGSGSPVASARAEGVIRMAVAPVISPRETFNSRYRDLLDYIGRELGLPVELVQGKTYAEINDMVRTGDVTFAFVCTNPYLQGRDDFGMELLAAPEVNGETTYYSYLVVRADSPFDSLADLRGSTFAFSDPLSNSGRLAPVYQLALAGETPESFFSRSIFTYAHDNSIKAVAENLVDGAAVDSLVYDYWVKTGSDYTSKTKVIEKWGPFGINPVVVRPGLDPALKQQLREVLLGMHTGAAGREILSALLIDRFVVPDDSIYDSVRKMRELVASAGTEE
jgi:phosphonate transport system substrate-binding protein